MLIKYRPNIDVNQVANGDYWLATDAKELGLVDQIDNSESYLSKVMENKQLFYVESQMKEKSLFKKLIGSSSLQTIVKMITARNNNELY